MMPTPTKSDRRQGLIRLAGVCAVAAVAWLLVLPRISMLPAVAARLQWLDEQRVDPSAMYYTEVEALKPVLKRLNERGRTKVSGRSIHEELARSPAVLPRAPRGNGRLRSVEDSEIVPP